MRWKAIPFIVCVAACAAERTEDPTYYPSGHGDAGVDGGAPDGALDVDGGLGDGGDADGGTDAGPYCVPHSATSCACPVGDPGTKTCNTEGTAYGPCQGCADPCASHSSCSDCAAQSSCGWCSSSSQCQSGDARFSFDQSCSGDPWRFGTASCAGSCTPNTTQPCGCTGGTGTQTCNSLGTGWGECRDCVPNMICTPNTTQACSCAGGGTGSQTCANDGLSWGDCTNCNSDPCAAHTTCGDCTAQTTCGWCTNGWGCKTGTYAGSDDTMCVVLVNWTWNPSFCAP